MLYSFKRFWLALILLAAGAQSSFGFALLGPADTVPVTWQTGTIGFGLAGDDGFPKDLGDGYRWNIRTNYYACDESFAEFFGSNGIAAIDQAFAVFNNLTNLSTYPQSLTNFPLKTARFNFTAQSLNLLDLKSSMMSQIINLLGLAQPDRYTWNIHDRFTLPGAPPCPAGENYIVVQRNFDPINYTYSSFVNGVLYDYAIQETCVPPNPVAIAGIVPTDPTVTALTAVAAGWNATYATYTVTPGQFYTGLTRDDVGGLRYLMATNRMNVEVVPASVSQMVAQQQILTNTLDLANLLQLSSANNAATLMNLFPGLVVTSETFTFVPVITTNTVATITTSPFGPAGNAQVTLTTVLTTNVQQVFTHTFGNVVTNSIFSQGFVTTQTTTVGLKNPFGPANGPVSTNINSSTALVNFVNGDFYIVPTNFCGGFINVTVVATNVIATVSNVPVTIGPGVTNGAFLPVTITTFTTNHTLVVTPVACVADTPILRQGIDKMSFVRRDFDSLLNRFVDPITNVFTLNAISNGLIVTQSFQRIITRPDIVIEAADEIVSDTTQFFVRVDGVGKLNFNVTQVSADGNGPGTMEPPVTFVFGKGGGPIFESEAGSFPDQGTALPFFEWGTFDGTTNNPIIYPDGTSLANLESQILFQVLTTNLPAYSVSTNLATPYHQTLAASGGAPPYTWALVNNSTLPAGLTLSSGGVIAGSGVSATNIGSNFVFTVQATDLGSRAATNVLSILINP